MSSDLVSYQPKYILELEIQDLPQTYNSMGRKHWAVKAKETRKWREYVFCQAFNKRPPNPLPKAKITYVRRSSKPLDYDNLVQSFKAAQDGLVDAKIIVNDKWENIGSPFYSWEQAPPGKGSVYIRIEEI